ncbi:conjugative transposon protein TraM [Flagellimonas sp.]|uniref:conjugative transposon protein TraM n=1 Tax=Flagellimonas sp. TaxID=2058762 RepID=UPI003BAC44FC
MKAQKNKIVFVLVMVCVVLFTTIYGIMTFGKDKEPELDPERIPIPDLEENQVEYDSKLRALEALKEEREVTAPPIYPDHMTDDKGYFNPDYMEMEKYRIIDSVMQSVSTIHKPMSILTLDKDTMEHRGNERVEVDEPTEIKTLGPTNQKFFTSTPNVTDQTLVGILQVKVDGRQKVREGHRIRLRLNVPYGSMPKYSLVYGFVKLRSNRMMVEVPFLEGRPVDLRGYDLQDGREGVYVETQLKGAMIDQGLDQTISDLNVPGFPRIDGIKGIFRKDHRAIKVDIPDNYQFILKTKP